MAELNNNMEQNEQNALDEQEVKAAEAAVGSTVPAAPEAPAVPEKKKFFAKGSKSRKIAQGIGIGILATGLLTLLGGIIYKVGETSGEKKAEGNVIDGDYTDVTDVPPADDTVPFDTDNTDI